MSIARSEFPVVLTVAGTVAVSTLPPVVLPFPAQLIAVTAGVGTAPTGSALNLDVLQNGTSVFTGLNTTKPSIAAGATAVTVSAASGVSAGQNVITPTVNDGGPIATFAKGDVLAVQVTQVGSTVAGANLGVTLHLAKK